MVDIFRPPYFQPVSVNGVPLAGAKLYFYQAGTTTDITVYQDVGLGTPHAQPVVADASGIFAAIYVNTSTYKIVLKTSADVTVATYDNVNSPSLFDSIYTKGSDVASDTTLNLDSATGPFVDITGTTTVTAVTLTAGRQRMARAVAALPFTASASLVVNGSTSINYTCTAGDLLLFEGYAASVVRVWIIGSAQQFVGQYRFPATQNASSDANTLDDYEEGTWTPVLTFATPGNVSVAYSVQVGEYQKLGNHVTLSFSIITSTFTHTTASGDLTITGLPFTAATQADHGWVGPCNISGYTKAGHTMITPRISSAASTFQFTTAGSGVTAVTLTASDMPTGGTVSIRGTLRYRV